MPSLNDLFPDEKPTRQNIVIDADFDNVDPVTKEYATWLLDYAHNTYGYNAPITSGYRDAERNANAGGAPNSWHMQGKAVDFDLSGLTPEQVSDIEAKAREKFGEVLYHDAGSGLHLHAANPIQSESVWDKVASVFTPAVAEASPATSLSLDALFSDNTQPQPVQTAQGNSLDALFSTTPQQTQTVTPPQQDLAAQAINSWNPSYTNTDIGKVFNEYLNEYVMQPAMNVAGTVLEYADKPRGAIAGAIKGIEDNGIAGAWEGAGKGWKENTSFKEVLPDNLINSPVGNALGTAAKTIFAPVGITAVAEPYYNSLPEADKNNLAKSAVGLGLDIALDPLWVVTPAKAVTATKALGKFVGAEKALAPVVSALERAKKSEQVQAILAKEFELPGWGNITVRRALSEEGPLSGLLDKLKLDKAKLNEEVAEAGKVLEPLSEKGREFVTRGIEAKPATVPDELLYDAISAGGKGINEGKLATDLISQERRADVLAKARLELPPEEAALVESAVDSLSKFGIGRSNELLKRGIISQETYDKYYGRYIRREYLKNENPLEFAKQLREAGNIKEAEKIEQAAEAISNARYKRSGVKMNWDDIKQRKELTEAEQEALGRIMDATHPFAKGGQVSSDLIAKYDFLDAVKTQFGKAEAQTGYRLLEGKGFGPLEGMWVPKEVFNEVTNTVKSLNNVDSSWRKTVSAWKAGKTILNPAGHARNFMSNAILLDIAGIPTAKVPIMLTRAAKEMMEKGKYWKEVKENTTILLDTFKKAEALQLEKPGLVKTVVDKAGDIYQKNEELGKLAAYIHARESGKGIEEAAKFANNALFDYGKVPPVLDYLRRSGWVPFASFPYFATKATAKTLYRDPMQILKYYKPSIAGKTEQEKAQEKLYPKWMNPHNYLPLGKSTRTVNGKEQNVDRYLDTSFIFPFDNDVSVSPAFTLAAALATNTNWITGADIARKGMLPTDKAGEYFKYAAQQLLPSFAPYGYSQEKLVNSFKGTMDKQGRQYSPTEAILHTIFGLKNVPINTDEMAKKAFQGMKRDAYDTRLMMRDIARDKRYSAEEKRIRINEYKEQIKLLAIRRKELADAYEKAKGKPIE